MLKNSALHKITTASSAGIPFAFLKKSEVCAVCAISQATLYRLISEGRFPHGILIGAASRRWKSTEVAAWLEATAVFSSELEAAHGASLKSKALKAVTSKKGAGCVAL